MGTDKVLSVEGMDCAGCERNIQFALAALPGVERVKADHQRKRVEVAFDPSAITEADIRRAVEDIGYDVEAESVADR